MDKIYSLFLAYIDFSFASMKMAFPALARKICVTYRKEKIRYLANFFSFINPALAI